MSVLGGMAIGAAVVVLGHLDGRGLVAAALFALGVWLISEKK